VEQLLQTAAQDARSIPKPPAAAAPSPSSSKQNNNNRAKPKHSKRDDMFCEHCKKPYHTIARCWAKHWEFRPTDWKAPSGVNVIPAPSGCYVGSARADFDHISKTTKR